MITWIDASWLRLVHVSITIIVYPQPLHHATLDFTFIHNETMRRAQSVRHYTRASVPTTGVNDMGALKEVPEESTEVSLRRQLLDKSKENDKVCNPSTLVSLLLILIRRLSFSMQLRDQIQALQGQLAQRPPIESIQELRKEYSNLELILQGTQRENERAMTELERLVSPTMVRKMSANGSCCTRFTGADKERNFLSASSRNLQGVTGRCASYPCQRSLEKLTIPVPLLPCTPNSCRLTFRSHLLGSLAHSPRVPLQVYFLPQCSMLHRQPRPTVI